MGRRAQASRSRRCRGWRCSALPGSLSSRSDDRASVGVQCQMFGPGWDRRPVNVLLTLPVLRLGDFLNPHDAITVCRVSSRRHPHAKGKGQPTLYKNGRNGPITWGYSSALTPPVGVCLDTRIAPGIRSGQPTCTCGPARARSASPHPRPCGSRSPAVVTRDDSGD